MSARFSRQLRLPEVGEMGQLAIEKSRVLIVGMGGLGCPAAQYLIASGVGCLGIADGDRVEEINLHRQILYSDQDLGKPKVEVAAKRLQSMNPSSKINCYFEPMSPVNAVSMLENYDMILDCTDNFETKYLLNDSCLKMKKTLISASATGFEANLMIVDGDGPCLRCLYPQVKSGDVGNCNLNGILGAFVGIVGSWQAAEVLKAILIHAGRARNLENPIGKVLFFDFYNSRIRAVSIKKMSDCFCTNKSAFKNKKKLRSINLTVDQVRGLDDYVLVDVRTDEERGSEPFLEFENSESTHRPHHEIVSGEFNQDQWQSNKKYVFFCSMGKRSAMVAQWLREHGVKGVYSMRRS
jgi:adenylyltransferase/sulfurtransferase